MVRGKAVDDVQVFPERLHILACAQHGSDLRSSVANLRHVFLTQEEVMRRHLTRNLDALLLGSTDDQDLKGKGEKLGQRRTISYSVMSKDVL